MFLHDTVGGRVRTVISKEHCASGVAAGQVRGFEPGALSKFQVLFVASDEVLQLAKGGDIALAAGVVGGRRGGLAGSDDGGGGGGGGGGDAGGAVSISTSSAGTGGWGGLGLRCRLGSFPAESGAAAVALLHTQIAVILRRNTLCTLVDAHSAPVCPATLGADGLSPAGAGGMAVALAVVALLALGWRWWRGGGPRTLARLGRGLAGVQGTPAPLAAPCRLPAVFPWSFLRCRGRWGRMLVFRCRGHWGRRFVLFGWCLLLGRRLLGVLGLVLTAIPTAGLRVLHRRYSASHKGKLIPAQQVLNPSMELRGQVIPEGLAVRRREVHGGLARPEVQREVMHLCMISGNRDETWPMYLVWPISERFMLG